MNKPIRKTTHEKYLEAVERNKNNKTTQIFKHTLNSESAYLAADKVGFNPKIMSLSRRAQALAKKICGLKISSNLTIKTIVSAIQKVLTEAFRNGELKLSMGEIVSLCVRMTNKLVACLNSVLPPIPPAKLAALV